MKWFLSKHNALYLRFGLKVGVACLLSYTVSYFLGSSYGVWAVVSAIVAMQLNVADSLQAGFLRFTATLLGAGAGVGLLLLTPRTPLYIGIAVFVATMICGFLTRFSNRFSPAAIAAMIVLLSGAMNANNTLSEAALFGFMRVAEIGIGVGAALLVSFVIWPVRLTDTLRADLSAQLNDSARIMDTLATLLTGGKEQYPMENLERLERHSWWNHERLGKARRHESILYSHERDVMEVQVRTLDRTIECLRDMADAINENRSGGGELLMGEELRDLANAAIVALHYMGGDTANMPAPHILMELRDAHRKAEDKMALLRIEGATRCFELRRVLRFFTFYQAIHQLSDSLIESLERLNEA